MRRTRLSALRRRQPACVCKRRWTRWIGSLGSLGSSGSQTSRFHRPASVPDGRAYSRRWKQQRKRRRPRNDARKRTRPTNDARKRTRPWQNGRACSRGWASSAAKRWQLSWRSGGPATCVCVAWSPATFTETTLGGAAQRRSRAEARAEALGGAAQRPAQRPSAEPRRDPRRGPRRDPRRDPRRGPRRDPRRGPRRSRGRALIIESSVLAISESFPGYVRVVSKSSGRARQDEVAHVERGPCRARAGVRHDAAPAPDLADDGLGEALEHGSASARGSAQDEVLEGGD